MIGLIFRTELRLVIANQTENKIENRIASKITSRMKNRLTNRVGNRLDIFCFYMNINFVRTCFSQIRILSKPNLSIIRNKKYKAELQKRKPYYSNDEFCTAYSLVPKPVLLSLELTVFYLSAVIVNRCTWVERSYETL